jgi:hypothetical protein
MPAAVLSSAPVAWNTLLTSLAGYDEAVQGSNRPMTIQMAPGDLLLVTAPAAVSVPTGATGVGVAQTPAVTANFPPEVIQMIQLAQLGWGAQLGAGRRISTWTAATLLRDMLTAYINWGTPRWNAVNQGGAP